MVLLFLTYNNYINRIVKKCDSIADYISQASNYKEISNINFKPNDSVETKQIINWSETWQPDYMVLCNGDTIVSRWFVIEYKRLRENQFDLDLRRDVIVDNYDTILNDDVFVEKAVLSNGDDIAIYNKEEIDFNQIKQPEVLLKDATNQAWVVGFYNSSVGDTQVTITNPIGNVKEVSTIESVFGDYLLNGYKYILEEQLRIRYRLDPNVLINGLGEATFDEGIKIKDLTHQYLDPKYKITGVPIEIVKRYEYFNKIYNILSSNKENIYNNFNSLQKYNKNNIIKNYENVYIYVSTGTTDYPAGYYKLKYNYVDVFKDYEEVDNNSLMLYINNILISANYNISQTTTNNSIVLEKTKIRNYYFSFEPVYNFGYKVQISSSANKLIDAPYKMFCIGAYDKLFALNIGSCIAKQLGSNLYDLQLLPYCPLQDKIDITAQNKYKIDMVGMTEHYDYDKVLKDEAGATTPYAYVYYCKSANFSFNISYNLNCPTDPILKKIENQCNMYRLCSPNYASLFEFNLAKTGSITNFNVDCTYKPQTPYIHINPKWSNLYGRDYDDTRGLICGGDFSIPYTSDKWVEYQIQNKNFQNAFNRQVESIEVRNKIAKINDVAGAAGGTIQSASSGAMIGGVYGAVAGGIAGAVSGGADIYLNQKLRNEALDLTKDQFNYNLQNIQALPNTLMKISAYDYNNKIFPILEYYTCTDEEKEIFKNKMKFNGMTIGRIDKLISFLPVNEYMSPNYFKCKLIRTNIQDDLHMANEVANELYKGVYLL